MMQNKRTIITGTPWNAALNNHTIQYEASNLPILRFIRKYGIQWAGNRKLKIYGSLHCRSGKRMKPENRVFFTAEAIALSAGYRPCGHCMKQAYEKWKHGTF